jgi:hypothetical protein
MRTLITFLILVAGAQAGCSADVPSAPVVSSSYEKPYDVVTSVRKNGCKLELRRYPEAYTKNKPALEGFWVQDVLVGDMLILRTQHSALEKERSLVIERASEYGVLQIDRDLDGRYEVLVVSSLKDERLKDVLFVTADGWLRHSSMEEYDIWLRREGGNKRAVEKADEVMKQLKGK